MSTADITSSIQYKNDYERLLTSYVSELIKRSKKDKRDLFAELRGFSIETVKKHDIFYIGEMVEMLIPSYMNNLSKLGVISETNKKPIFHNRWVIPIKTPTGLVQNLVGYSPDANERYIYGTAKYYRRRETVYGLENLQLAYDMGYAILTEGITDVIRLRDLGYPNSFATCGTWKSDFVVRQLNRCRYGVIRIPDRDNAGLRAVKGWEFNRHITLLVNLQYKDIDEMCKVGVENQQWVRDYLADCINWITGLEHHGKPCVCEQVTIM